MRPHHPLFRSALIQGSSSLPRAVSIAGALALLVTACTRAPQTNPGETPATASGAPSSTTAGTSGTTPRDNGSAPSSATAGTSGPTAGTSSAAPGDGTSSPSSGAPGQPASASPSAGAHPGSCTILDQISGETAGGPSGTEIAYRVVRDGGCTAGPDTGAYLLVDAREPRRIGYERVTVLHPGDTLLLPAEESLRRDWADSPGAREALFQLKNTGLDPHFNPFGKDVPKGTQPLVQLTKLTNGLLKGLGTFDYQDARDADGSHQVRVAIEATAQGSARLTLVQSYRRTNPRDGSEASGLEERPLAVEVAPAGTPITARFGGLEESVSSIRLGVTDFVALSISLGYQNRGGSEERGPVGVKVTDVQVR